jgi:gluconolactonase
MSLNFQKIAGPYQGGMGGLAWDGERMLFSTVDEGFIRSYDPATGQIGEYRKYANRINGIAFAPDGRFFACQDGGRRVIQFLADGTAAVTATRLDGAVHNHPSDLVIDRAGRVWFTDPFSRVIAFGPQIFPPLDHASVLRLEVDERHAWKIVRMTFDTAAPRAVQMSPDEKMLYVAEGEVGRKGPRELRAYAVRDDGTLGPFTVLHAFGADHRGEHRGIEGMCIDSDGHLLACGGSAAAGAGPRLYTFAPDGALLESQPLPGGAPMRVAFGDAGLDSLYLTSGDGCVYRAQSTGRRGFKRW